VWKDIQGHYRELLVQAIQAAIAQARMKREADEAQRQIREARDRAEMPLREVNHRVANSLAMVSSLIQLQSHSVTDRPTRDLLHETQARITAIASVHRRLYTSDDVRSVELNSYLSTLVEDIASSMPGPHRPIRFIPSHLNVVLPTDKAVALGVIVTELVTNSQKYAYEDGQRGEIRVRIVAAYSTRTISVEDDGIGWAGKGTIRGSGLGSRIIKGMAQNLQSEVVYENAHRGTRAAITFAV
jgi:two-component sensor histidine kinase